LTLIEHRSRNAKVAGSNPSREIERKNKAGNVIWFNPPYTQHANVLTNVGGAVLELVDKHFPPGNTLRKIFNRNAIKISYSCMNNMASIIKGHNKKVLNNEKASSAGCNCIETKITAH
jgi:hypothetical protein